MIGVTTGWLNEIGITNLQTQIDYINDCNADGIEIVWKDIQKDQYETANFYNLRISIHLPTKVQNWDLINDIQQLTNALLVKHPINNTEGCAVENMDPSKTYGYKLEELSKYDKIVLDIQHLYERDPTMEYGKMLYKELKPKIVELHISGEHKHELLYHAPNKTILTNFLKQTDKNIPWIIEGRYTNKEELRKEIKFLKEIKNTIK